MLKWGNTEVKAVKWGNTTCTAVYWGGTKVFPNEIYNGSNGSNIFNYVRYVFYSHNSTFNSDSGTYTTINTSTLECGVRYYKPATTTYTGRIHFKSKNTYNLNNYTSLIFTIEGRNASNCIANIRAGVSNNTNFPIVSYESNCTGFQAYNYNSYTTIAITINLATAKTKSWASSAYIIMMVQANDMQDKGDGWPYIHIKNIEFTYS